MPRSPLFLMMCLIGILPARTGACAEPLPPPQAWLPADTVIAVHIARPAALLDPLLSEEFAARVRALPFYGELVARPEFDEFRHGIAFLERQLGADWRTALRALAGTRVALAVTARGAGILCIDAADRSMLARLEETVRAMARDKAASEGAPERVTSRTYKGATLWSLGEGQAHAIIDHRLLVTNGAAALETVLDLRSGGFARPLSAQAAYTAAMQAAAEAPVQAFVNLAILKLHPEVSQSLAHTSNPMEALLGVALKRALSDASWLSAALDITPSGVALRCRTDAAAPAAGDPAAFNVPPAGRAAPAAIPLPRRIAALSFWRDLKGFYTSKDALFPERTSGLIFFENMMGIFFSGLDITDEIMAAVAPEIRFVAAEQSYDSATGAPRVKVPGFALILRLHDPDAFGDVIEEAWQKALGLINFTRGQQAQPGLIIDRLTHGATRFSTAYFRVERDADRGALPMRFNFTPSLALVGDHVILSSSEGLTRDLIDALSGGAAPAAALHPGAHTFAEVDGDQAASILAANRENLVAANMIDKGHTRAQAETEVDMLLLLLRAVRRITLECAYGDHRPEALLTLDLQYP